MNGPTVILTDIDEFLGAIGRDAQHERIVSNEIHIQRACSNFDSERLIHASYLRRTGPERWDQLIVVFRGVYATAITDGGYYTDLNGQRLTTDQDIVGRIVDAARPFELIVQQGAVTWDDAR